MFDKIVVPLDLTPDAESAIPYGMALASQAGAALELLTVVPPQADAVEPTARLADAAERHGADATPRVVTARHTATGIRIAADAPDTLVCVQTRARRALGEMLLGSVSEELVRTNRHPLMLVGPGCGPAPQQFRSLIACLDGSPYAEQILPVVADLAPNLGLRTWLFQALPALAPLETEDADIHETAYLHRQAERLAFEYGTNAEWDVARDRSPALAVARFADAHPASILALTTHGRSGISRLALGSVVLEVARRAAVPVLLLRPEHDDGGGNL